MEQRRRRFLGFEGSHAPQYPAPSAPPMRGTPPDEPQPSIVILRWSLTGTRHLREKAKEVCRRGLFQFARGHILERGESRCSVFDECRFVALAAMWQRRQVGGVCLDQQT